MELLHPFFVLFVLSSYSSQAIVKSTSLSTKKAIEIEHKIFNFNFSEASTELSTFNVSPKKLYLENTIDVLRILTSDNEYLFDSLAYKEQARSELVDKNSIDVIYKSEIHFQWAIVKLFYGHEGAAALSLKKSFSLLQNSKSAYPKNTLNNKLDGLYNTILGNAPNNYKWLLELLGYHGDESKGMQLLGLSDRSQNLLSKEKILVYHLLNVNLFNNEVDTAYSLNRTTNLELLGSVNMLINKKQFLLAEKQFKKIEIDKSNNIPYLKHVKSQLDFHLGRYNSCILNALHFQSTTQGTTFIKYSNLLIFYSNIMLDKEQGKLLQSLSRISNSGDIRNTKDRFSQKFSQAFTPTKTKLILLKSRLHYDSGNNKLALNTINTLKPNDLLLNDQIEFYYRTSRIFQSRGNSRSARLLYQKAWDLTTSNKSKDINYFFAAKSCLELGNLYLEAVSTSKSDSDKESNIRNAERCLNAAIKFKNHDYENDIEFKAKLELKKLQFLK